jgi:hypothetical protein
MPHIYIYFFYLGQYKQKFYGECVWEILLCEVELQNSTPSVIMSKEPRRKININNGHYAASAAGRARTLLGPTDTKTKVKTIFKRFI